LSCGFKVLEYRVCMNYAKSVTSFVGAGIAATSLRLRSLRPLITRVCRRTREVWRASWLLLCLRDTKGPALEFVAIKFLNGLGDSRLLSVFHESKASDTTRVPVDR
jgi:hypothetical protein